MLHFPGRAGLLQRVLPNYRAPFFDALASKCEKGLGVFAGKPRQAEMINAVDHLQNAELTIGENLHLLGGRAYFCVQIGVIKWLSEWNPDVLIVEANPRYLHIPRAVHWMHKRNRPVIGWGLGAPPLEGQLLSALRMRQRCKFIQQFDRLITYSQVGASQYAQLGFPADRIDVAINAMTPPPSHPMPVRSSPSLNVNLVVLFVGRLQKRKNLDNLIKACAKLPPELQPELVIVGDGPKKLPLEDLAAQEYPKTTFTGALYGEALAEQFSQADLFVLPGTGGLAIQQAMSYGLPIIAAQADGTQQDLVRLQNGWQIPPNNIDALRITLEAALSDLNALREKGKESYRIVAEEINLDQMVRVFVSALNRSLA
jgi:glycosyltransferase involved in cell wall biosynthesis